MIGTHLHPPALQQRSLLRTSSRLYTYEGYENIGKLETSEWIMDLGCEFLVLPV